MARSATSSSRLRRSNSSVAYPAPASRAATCWFRGLSRLEPLPCANTMMPRASGGTVRSPPRATRPAWTMTGIVCGFSGSSGSTMLMAHLTVTGSLAVTGARVSCSRAARLRISRTSSSVVCEKSSYQRPTAWNIGGVCKQIS